MTFTKIELQALHMAAGIAWQDIPDLLPDASFADQLNANRKAARERLRGIQGKLMQMIEAEHPAECFCAECLPSPEPRKRKGRNVPTHRCGGCTRTIHFGRAQPKPTWCPNCKNVRESVPICPPEHPPERK